mgnify:CR=1 FL=1
MPRLAAATYEPVRTYISACRAWSVGHRRAGGPLRQPRRTKTAWRGRGQQLAAQARAAPLAPGERVQLRRGAAAAHKNAQLTRRVTRRPGVSRRAGAGDAAAASGQLLRRRGRGAAPRRRHVDLRRGRRISHAARRVGGACPALRHRMYRRRGAAPAHRGAPGQIFRS